MKTRESTLLWTKLGAFLISRQLKNRRLRIRPPFPKMRLRPLQLLPIQHDIHLLVVETHQSGDRPALERRPGVEPHHVLVRPAVDLDGVVFRFAFVGTLRAGWAAAEKGGVVDGGQGEVVPAGEAGFVEVRGGWGGGDEVAGEGDLDGALGVEAVDSFERVFGVDVDGGILFQPFQCQFTSLWSNWEESRCYH